MLFPHSLNHAKQNSPADTKMKVLKYSEKKMQKVGSDDTKNYVSEKN